MSSIVKVAVCLLLLLLVLVGGLVAFVFATEFAPDPQQSVRVEGAGDGEGIEVGKPFKLISWNLQYGASRKHQFFYDGGDVVHVPPADVTETVGAISDALASAAPDIALLQEIDRDSTRTGRIDQLPAYVKGVGATAWSATPYHKAAFVPKPFTQPLSRVHLSLGVLTRGPQQNVERRQLALMDEPRVVQALNLKRALLTAEVPVAGHAQPLAVAVTHLSAFSFGDGTLEKQVAALSDWMKARPEGQPWILAGDLNLLPPGDDPQRLAQESELYADASNPIEALLPAFTEVFGAQQLDPSVRTYLPFGAGEPDRKIDYVFVGGPITVVEASVLREHSAISDHLPIVATLVVGTPPPVEPSADEGTVPAAELPGVED